MIALFLWLTLRFVTSIFTAFVSSIKPITPLELSLPLFPVNAPLSVWLERVLISPWTRWDVDWYQRIVSQGYTPTDGTAQFHPLYPWLATPLEKIGVSPVLSLLVVSSLAGLALFFLFWKLARLDLTPEQSTFALFLFGLFPPSLILFAPYPEALFLLLAVLCFWLARRKKWLLAGLIGGLASLTRQQGLFLIIPVAWELWEENRRDFSSLIKSWHHWLSLILIPGGYAIWIITRGLMLSDWGVRWTSVQDFIYSFMISPSANQVVPVQKFLWPWQALSLAIIKLVENPDTDIWVDLISGVVYLLILILAWKRMRISYRLYSAVIYLVSFSYYTGSIHPYMGLPRHLFLAFPLFIGLARRINKPWVRLISVGVSLSGMAFFSVLYVINTWVP
jgi:Gpi18-like mannosyltransferase